MEVKPEIKDLINKSLAELRGILKKERSEFWVVCISDMKRCELIQHIEIMRKMKVFKEETLLLTGLSKGALPARDITTTSVVDGDLEMELPTIPKPRPKGFKIMSSMIE
jgi:hypothetical protein